MVEDLAGVRKATANSKALGPEQPPNALLKVALHEGLKLLSELHNNFLAPRNRVEMPHKKWKYAIVTVALKNTKDRSGSDNYLPWLLTGEPQLLPSLFFCCCSLFSTWSTSHLPRSLLTMRRFNLN